VELELMNQLHAALVSTATTGSTSASYLSVDSQSILCNLSTEIYCL